MFLKVETGEQEGEGDDGLTEQTLIKQMIEKPGQKNLIKWTTRSYHNVSVDLHSLCFLGSGLQLPGLGSEPNLVLEVSFL